MMMTIFIIFMLVVFGKIGWLAVKAAWGIAKVLVTFVLLPVILIALVASGFIAIALPILIVIGIISLICKPMA